MLPVCFLGIFICNILGTFSSQKYARRSESNGDILIYSLVTGLIATAVFYITSGFSLNLNLRTSVYTLLFALVIFANYFTSLLAYRFMGIAECTFIRSGLSLAMTVLAGVFFFGETFSLRSFSQIVLVFLTLLVIFVPSLKDQPNANTKAVTFSGTVISISSAVLGTLCNGITNAFAEDKGVTDENSFFFLTNAFIVAMSLVSVLFAKRFSVKAVCSDLKSISRSGYFMIVLNVVSSNISSLLGIFILRDGDLIFYAPLSSALILLAGETWRFLSPRKNPKFLQLSLHFYRCLWYYSFKR